MSAYDIMFDWYTGNDDESKQACRWPLYLCLFPFVRPMCSSANLGIDSRSNLDNIFSTVLIPVTSSSFSTCYRYLFNFILHDIVL